MCRSIADGGQRCAAHTRAAFEAAQTSSKAGSAEWMQAASEYASTREGAQHFEFEATSARTNHDYEDEAQFKSVLQRGDTQRKVNDESRLRIIEATTQTPIVSGKPTRLVGDTFAFHDADQVHKVFRPYDRRINNLRYVQEPDGTVWTINKHNVVTRQTPSKVFAGWSDMQFPETGDQEARIRQVARDVDNEFKRCICC